jgi:hypothetical protein
MTIKNYIVAAILLLSASLFAQNASYQAPGAMQVMARRAAARHAILQSADAMASQQMQELEATVSKMLALLKEMQVRAASSKSTTTQDNLHMWELLVGHLNDTLTRSRLQASQRSNLLARRNAMYRQAEANNDAATAAARNAEELSGATLGPGAQAAPAIEPPDGLGSAPNK